MLTPRFTIEQDADFLYINIKALYAKVTIDSEPEVIVDGNEFKFYAKPYYLRLHLPGELTENGQESASYENGIFNIKYPKLNSGEYFEGLNLLTKLLTFPKKLVIKPRIEVLDDKEQTQSINYDEENNFDGNFDNDDDDVDDDQWHIEQKLDSNEILSSIEDVLEPKYGFANSYTGFLSTIQEELNVFDIKDVKSLQMKRRREMRMKSEQNNFNEEYYLADYFQNDYIKILIKFSKEKFTSGVDCSFSDEEKDILLKLPQKEYLLSKNDELIAIFGLVDILYSFVFNFITTEGENTVESGWTISKLSATLSWLDYFENFKDVVVSCFRRSLIYPLYRNFLLCEAVFKHLIYIFKQGQHFIIKCLIEIRNILNDSDDRYILNELYIQDYCVWVQSLRPEKFQEIAKELESIVIVKTDLGLDLDVLESAGFLALNNINNTAEDKEDETSSSDDSTDESNSHF